MALQIGRLKWNLPCSDFHIALREVQHSIIYIVCCFASTLVLLRLPRHPVLLVSPMASATLRDTCACGTIMKFNNTQLVSDLNPETSEIQIAWGCMFWDYFPQCWNDIATLVLPFRAKVSFCLTVSVHLAC